MKRKEAYLLGACLLAGCSNTQTETQFREAQRSKNPETATQADPTGRSSQYDFTEFTWSDDGTTHRVRIPNTLIPAEPFPSTNDRAVPPPADEGKDATATKD